MTENRPPLTEADFFTGKINFETPEALSYRDTRYAEQYGGRLTMSDVKSLCVILQHSPEEIFTTPNLVAIGDYDKLVLEEERQAPGSGKVKNLLSEIYEEKDEQKRQFRMNEVLFDCSLLLSKHIPEELKLRVAVYNNLLEKGYIKIDPKPRSY